MKHPDYYRYPAVFEPDDGGWAVSFPDLENCFTSADTLDEAIIQAQAVLEDCMYFREAQKDDIPTPSAIGAASSPSNGLVQMVVAFMPPVRRAWSRRAVKKTLTIPAWMEEELKKRDDVNVSQLLQEAIKRELNLKEPAVL